MSILNNILKAKPVTVKEDQQSPRAEAKSLKYSILAPFDRIKESWYMARQNDGFNPVIFGAYFINPKGEVYIRIMVVDKVIYGATLYHQFLGGMIEKKEWNVGFWQIVGSLTFKLGSSNEPAVGFIPEEMDSKEAVVVFLGDVANAFGFTDFRVQDTGLLFTGEPKQYSLYNRTNRSWSSTLLHYSEAVKLFFQSFDDFEAWKIDQYHCPNRPAK